MSYRGKRLQMIFNFQACGQTFILHLLAQIWQPLLVCRRKADVCHVIRPPCNSPSKKAATVLMHFSQGDSRQVKDSCSLVKQNYSAIKKIYLAEDSFCSSHLRFIGLALLSKGDLVFLTGPANQHLKTILDKMLIIL